MPIKIVVIGCGWVSNAYHGPAYAEYASTQAGVVLAACCDEDLRRAEAFRDRFGFARAYTDYREMLEHEQPQSVALNVPPALISPIGCDILQQGFPLLCEKPPGLTLEEIDLLTAAARSGGAIHQVAFNRRFMPLMIELKRQLEGLPIHHIEIQQARVRRTDVKFATTAIHVIDAARFLAGADYKQINITYQELPEMGPGVANYLLDGRFHNGTTTHMAITPVSGINVERTTVHAFDHTFLLHANNGPDAPGHLWHYHDGKLVSELDAISFTGRREAYFLDGFYQEDAAFFDAVQAGQQPAPDFQSCRQSVEIMQCITERKEWRRTHKADIGLRAAHSL